MSSTMGFVVEARFVSRFSLWPYQQLCVEIDRVLIRNWPINLSRPVSIPKEKIGFFAWKEILGFPVLGIYDKYSVLIGSISSKGDWERLVSVLVEQGYKFAEEPIRLPGPLVL